MNPFDTLSAFSSPFSAFKFLFQPHVNMEDPFESERHREHSLEPLPEPSYIISMNAEFEPIFKLGRAERLQLVEDLWDSLAGEDDLTPVPDWKRNELRRRKEQYAQHPASGIVWADVKQRARAHHG